MDELGPPRGLALLLGGARSGKSRLAVELARAWGDRVVVIVTGRAVDEEMAARIERHRAERPQQWVVVEEGVEVEGALADASWEACVIVDCLTLWVANLMETGLDDTAIEERAAKAAARAGGRAGPTLVVSNEVGSGIVPVNPLGRRYRDVLGRVNAIWAKEADHAALVVAGRVLPLAPPAALWGAGDGR